MGTRRLPGPTEADVMAACVRLLTFHRWDVMRFNAGGAKLPGHGGRGQFVRFGPTGMSDLLCLKQGYPALFLEVKARRGKLRDSQKLFGDRVMAAGHAYAVVRDAAELQAVLDSMDT
jgi:hypothetical protein